MVFINHGDRYASIPDAAEIKIIAANEGNNIAFKKRQNWLSIFFQKLPFNHSQ